jgi:hypothetical protein
MATQNGKNAKLGIYSVSCANPMSNAFLIEGDAGLTLIDAGFSG